MSLRRFLFIPLMVLPISLASFSGRYQEILGSDHNLMGDTHVAEVPSEPPGRLKSSWIPEINCLMSSKFGHHSTSIMAKMESRIHDAKANGQLTKEEASESILFGLL